MDRAALDPETRKAEFEARKAEAEVKHVVEVNAMTGELTKQKELELKIAERQLEKEQVKKGVVPGAKPRLVIPGSIKLEFAMGNDEAETKLDFLVEPFLPRASVVGFYGRGETAKSSLLATMAADISTWASTLWISSEENEARIRVRHTKGALVEEEGQRYFASVGQPGTLQTFVAVVFSTDTQGRSLTSDFNVYEHLESTIIAAKVNLQNLPPQHQPAKPIRLVVLDAIVALTTWDRHAGTNSDEGVKRLMSFLRGIAEREDVTIAVVGHSNKGKQDHFADSVMGASAWVNSPRISFLHGQDRTTEGQVIVRVAKTNEIPHMAQLFRVELVHELHQFADGPRAGMMKLRPLARVWGRQNAEDLWDEVTKVPKEDRDEGAPNQGLPTAVQNTVQLIVEVLMTTEATQLTRAEVEQRLQDAGKKIDRHRWLQVDAFFVGHPTIEAFKDVAQKNLTVYRRKPT